MRTILLFILLYLLLQPVPASGRELYPGQYDNVDAKTQQWFKSQRVPNGQFKGMLCCNEADGAYVEEDIREGHYWARGGPFKEFVPVPDEVVIPEGNRNGAPVLWTTYQNGVPEILCYAPGGGV
jgi:hypothetical protein